MGKPASSTRYAIASALVILITVLIDYFCLRSEVVIENLTDDSASQTKVIKSNTAIKLASNPKHMELVNISLPNPPSMQSSHDIKAVPSQDLGTLSPNYESESMVVEDSELHQRQSNDSSRLNTYTDTMHNKAQITHSLNQLMALEGANRTLYFPASNTSQILAYMHNCVGIDVGAVEQNNLTLFSHKNSRHSQIVRAANGFKTDQERALLAAYAPNQTLVRLYPLWFDERLGSAIATHLGKQALTQLSGHYTLVGKTLSLTNIKLNNESVNQEWLLSQGC